MPWSLDLTYREEGAADPGRSSARSPGALPTSAAVHDAAGAPVLSLRDVSIESLETARRIRAAVNATQGFTREQLEAGLPVRLAAALRTVVKASAGQGTFILKPRVLKALETLVAELPK